MPIKTYYWNDNIQKKRPFFRPKLAKKKNNQFFYGNAGDIFAKDLIKYIYGVDDLPTNEGGRVLLIGSIAHKIEDNDIICGIGTKMVPFSPSLNKNNLIFGLRGPLTYDFFKKQGFNVDDVKFLYDPGLLIGEVFSKKLTKKRGSKISFLPHYREKKEFLQNPPKGMSIIDIDNKPITVAKKILDSEVVYSSSLHGIIFSHALGVPAVFVAPQTQEPQYKYEDYYLSVDLPYPKPLSSIHEANFKSDLESLPNKTFTRKDFTFPTLSELKELSICI